jgi:predicted dehydrogenase
VTVVALVGCGGISRDGYIPAIAHLQPQTVLTYDVDPGAASRAQAELVRLGLDARAVSDVVSLGESDSVIIAVPPSQTPETVSSIVSARADRAILLEKPLATSFELARSLLGDIDEATDVRYMETFLHSTAYDVLLGELGTGRLGAVRKLRCRVKGGTPSDLENQWRGSRALGGEVLHDWGIHSLGLVLHLARTAGLGRDGTDAEWARFGVRKILTACAFDVLGLAIPVEVDASWSGSSRSMESPDVSVECERGTLGLFVRKTEGSSDWTCVERQASGGVRMLASRRYPKELFVRGVAGFLARGANGASAEQSKFDIGIGMEALRLADSAYNQAVSSASTSSD